MSAENENWTVLSVYGDVIVSMEGKAWLSRQK